MHRHTAFPIDWLKQQASAHKFHRGVGPAALSLPIPPGFSGHDFVIYLLTIAAEIEHALMVQYLYSAYSMGGPQVPPEHRAAVLDWQNTLLGIAKEEMGHFITVQNILRVLGGPLNFRREDFPWDSDVTPFPFSLEPLSKGVVAKYVVTESPPNWGSDVSPATQAQIEAQADENAKRKVKPVGILYAYMIELLKDPRIVPDSAFLADSLPYQASWDEWGRAYAGPSSPPAPGQERRPDLLIGTAYSRTSAVEALKAVAEQGEAPDMDYGADEHSHFKKFLNLWLAYPADGTWTPFRPVATNPIVPFDPNLPQISSRGLKEALAAQAPLAVITNPITARWGILSNLRYRILLNYLAHSLSLSGPDLAQPPDNARGLLTHSTFGEMYNLRALAGTLVQLPLGDADDPVRAGPPFQMPYTLSLPAEESARWRVHLDLLTGAGELIEWMLPDAAGYRKDYLLALRGADAETMKAIRTILDRCRPSTRL
jgi:hypothetical protein